MTLSPQSTWGVQAGLCLPRGRIATTEARRPATRPFASITTHFFSTSAGFSDVVFMAPDPVAGFHDPKRQTAAKAAAAMGGDIGAGGGGVNRKGRGRGRKIVAQLRFECCGMMIPPEDKPLDA